MLIRIEILRFYLSFSSLSWLKLRSNWYYTCYCSSTKMHVRNDRHMCPFHPTLASSVGDYPDSWEFQFAKLIGERPLNIEMLKLQKLYALLKSFTVTPVFCNETSTISNARSMKQNKVFTIVSFFCCSTPTNHSWLFIAIIVHVFPKNLAWFIQG